MAVAQPTAVSAQEGKAIAALCRDPEFRQFISEVFFGGFITLDSVGECVSLIHTLFVNDTQSSRVITLICQDREALAYFGNQGRCVAALNAEFKH